MSDDTLPSNRPFFDFAQAAQDLLLHQLQGLKSEDPATHATLTKAPATWRVAMTLQWPSGQVLVTSDATLPSGEVIGLEAVEFQRRTAQ